MPEIIDFKKPESERHYVTPVYGRPCDLPDGWPRTFVPAYPHATKYADEAPVGTPSAILIRPRGQETPVRTLGDTATWGDKHPIQKTFAQDTVQLAKEQPWLTAFLVGAGALVFISLFKAFGKVEG